ncbi:S9 family peptidase [soil metagenome]
MGGGSFSADESKLLINSNATGIYNLYALKVDGSGMDTITRSNDESIFALSYFPNDDRILYAADKGGNEISHIYLLHEDGSEIDLTPGETEKAEFAGWSRGGKSFFYVSNKRDPKYFDLYEMTINDFKSNIIYKNNEGYSISGFSDNKNYIVLNKPITTSVNELYVYDVGKNFMTQVSSPGSNSSSSSQEISTDNRYLYFTTDEGEEFSYLNRYDLEMGIKEKILKTDWDIWYAYHSWNEKYRIVGINEDARTAIKLTERESNKQVAVPEIPDGDITAVNISKSENLMRLSVGSSKAPSDIYIYNLDTKDLKKLTNSLNPEINANDLVAGEVIRYKSFDGVEIPAILYKPKFARKENKAPVLVWVHGGPGGQTRLNYFPLLQYLVNNGYGVIGVNNRGSSGYGKTFYRMDDQRHGEDDLLDCIKSKDYLATLDWVDTSQIGIIGGSYGGYMVMAAMAFQPEAFDVGVNIFGVTNWIRTLRSIPSWWEANRKALYEELGDPYSEDSVRLHKISPLFHAHNVTKPLMVLQGANDPRVLQVESDEIVAAVQKNGVPVEYVLFPDEGHGFRKKENEIKGYGDILTFLDKHLKKENDFDKLNQ